MNSSTSCQSHAARGRPHLSCVMSVFDKESVDSACPSAHRVQLCSFLSPVDIYLLLVALAAYTKQVNHHCRSLPLLLAAVFLTCTLTHSSQSKNTTYEKESGVWEEQEGENGRYHKDSNMPRRHNQEFLCNLWLFTPLSSQWVIFSDCWRSQKSEWW